MDFQNFKIYKINKFLEFFQFGKPKLGSKTFGNFAIVRPFDIPHFKNK